MRGRHIHSTLPLGATSARRLAVRQERVVRDRGERAPAQRDVADDLPHASSSARARPARARTSGRAGAPGGCPRRGSRPRRATRRGPSTASLVPSRVVRAAREPARRRASSDERRPRGRLDARCRRGPRTALAPSAPGAARRPRGGARAAARRRAAGAISALGLPAEARGQPADEQQPGDRRARGCGGRSPTRSSRARRAQVRRVERRPRCARATASSAARRGRRRRRASASCAARSERRAGRGRRRSPGGPTWASREERVDGLGVAVRRPDRPSRRSVTTSGSTIRSSCLRCSGPTSTTIVSRISANSPGSGVAGRGDRSPSRRASCGPGSTRRRSCARRGSARPAAAGWRSRRSTRGRRCDEVQRARRRRSRRSPRGRSAIRLAQRLLDRRRASCRSRSRRCRCVGDASDRPPRVVAERAARRPPPGPACRPRTAAAARASAAHACTIGSMMRHCASTSSLRVKSVASPRMASRISRS